MARKFSNSRSTSTLQIVTANRKPYVAKTLSSLTPKEREARRISKVGNFGGAAGNTAMASAGQFFSPQLSTDFLELPQSLREKREIYRHFYNTDPIVGQAIDLHTELPLSKVRLGIPKPSTYPEGFKSQHDYASYILWWFTDMTKRIKLFQRLVTMVHHYWLDGSCVTGDTLVSTSEGEQRADTISLGTKLLTHTGRWKAVEVVHQQIGTDILSLDVARLPYRLNFTKEHPLEVLRGDRFEFQETKDIAVGDFVRVTWPTEEHDVTSVDLLAGTPSFVTACPGGYVVQRTQRRSRVADAGKVREGLLNWLRTLPEPTRRSRISIAKELGVQLHTLHNVILTLDQELPYPFRKRVPGGPKLGDHTLWLPLSLPEDTQDWHYNIYRDFTFTTKTTLVIDNDFLYLVGYWLGDGTLSRDSTRPESWGRGTLGLFFGEASVSQKERIYSILFKLFGDKIYEYTDENKVTKLALTHNPAFVEWWASQFGCTSRGPNPKRIPEWVLHLPKDKQRHLIAGLIDSDGCISVSEENNSVVSLSLVSDRLIYRIRDILLRLGCAPSMRVAPPCNDSFIDGQLVKSNGPSYVLSLNDKEECHSVCAHAIKATKFAQPSKWVSHHTSYKRVGDQLAFQVRDIEGYQDEVVYNFQVEGDHTFRAGFVSTHNCFIFAEDSTVDIPSDLGYEKKTIGKKSVVTDQGEAKEDDDVALVEQADREDQELLYYQKNYRGLERLIVLPIDQVKVTTYSFTDKMRIELIPSDRDRALIELAKSGDPVAEEMANEIPDEVREHMEQGKLIPLGTDPDEGSFCYYLSGRKAAGDDLGQSILDRCLRVLMYKEKLRQAQTQIASRAMTPKRIVWGDRISQADVDDLREQVDLALVDPDYSIVTNYEIHWEEMGSKDRLLDLSSEYEICDKQLHAGLGVTESLLSGETLYSGDRLKLEVINTRYLFLREMVQEYVEEYLFKPVARRKGFVEKNQWGGEVVLFPRLSFTRLPLRDSQDTYDALFNLYQKGSIDISLILEMFNIDADDTRVKLENDVFTINDSTFNEVLRGVYSSLGQKLVDETDVFDKIREYLKLKMKPAEQPEAESRY